MGVQKPGGASLMCGCVILPQAPIGIREVDETYNLKGGGFRRASKKVSCVPVGGPPGPPIIRPHSAYRSFW